MNARFRILLFGMAWTFCGIEGALAQAYETVISGAPPALQDLIESASRLVTAEDAPPATYAGLQQRANNDRGTMLTVLRSEGYYGAAIDIAIETTATPARVHVEIMPGPRYVLSECTLSYQGGRPEGAAETCEALGLTAGMPARASPIIEAGNRLLRRLYENGYARAAIARRDAVVDHAAREMRLAFDVSPGPRMQFGPLVVSGTVETRAEFLERIKTWEEGEAYDIRTVDAYRERLVGLNLFDQLNVSLGESENGVAPVVVEAHEGPARSIGGGLRYATDEGSGANVFWEHRNFLGNAEVLNVSLTLATITQSLAVTFSEPHTPQPGQSLSYAVDLANNDFDAYRRQGINGLVSLRTPLTDWIGSNWNGVLSVAFEAAEITSKGASAGQKRFSLLGSLPMELTYDSTFSLFNPQNGERLSFNAEPVAGTSGGGTFFMRVGAETSLYRPLDDDGDTVAAARAKLGAVLFSGSTDVPPDRRFYAGGGGSVRGFGYQRIGPRDATGNPTGGLSVVETGLELRHRFTETIGGVAFVDAGKVSPDANLLNAGMASVGAGLGVRYYTDIGPIRVDVGVPLNNRSGEPSMQIYISLGQAF